MDKNCLKHKNALLVFDIDGVLSSYNYGKLTAHHELDGELSEAEFRKIDLYATAKGIPAIRDFIRGLDIDNVYCLSMEPHGHEASKTKFVHDYYGIKKTIAVMSRTPGKKSEF